MSEHALFLSLGNCVLQRWNSFLLTIFRSFYHGLAFFQYTWTYEIRGIRCALWSVVTQLKRQKNDRENGLCKEYLSNSTGCKAIESKEQGRAQEWLSLTMIIETEVLTLTIFIMKSLLLFYGKSQTKGWETHFVVKDIFDAFPVKIYASKIRQRKKTFLSLGIKGWKHTKTNFSSGSKCKT